jgi:hypothetical protein
MSDDFPTNPNMEHQTQANLKRTTHCAFTTTLATFAHSSKTLLPYEPVSPLKMSAVPPAVPDTTAAVAAAPSAPAPANAGVAEPEHNEQVHPPEAPRDQAPKAEKLPTSTLRGQLAHLWSAAKQHGHPEIWGVTLADPASHIPTQIVLHKYLNANDGDLDKATDQLIKTLEWRAKMKPLDLLKKKFNPAKFGKLGYVTTYAERENETDAAAKEVFTWNVYGAVKSIDETFGNLEE